MMVVGKVNGCSDLTLSPTNQQVTCVTSPRRSGYGRDTCHYATVPLGAWALTRLVYKHERSRHEMIMSSHWTFPKERSWWALIQKGVLLPFQCYIVFPLGQVLHNLVPSSPLLYSSLFWTTPLICFWLTMIASPAHLFLRDTCLASQIWTYPGPQWLMFYFPYKDAYCLDHETVLLEILSWTV